MSSAVHDADWHSNPSSHAVAKPLPASGQPGHEEHLGLWGPGVRWLRRMRFTGKAMWVSAVLVLPMLALVAGLVQAQWQQARQARADATRQTVQAVSGVLSWAHAQEQQGSLSREQAQQAALAAVAALRYSGEEYFWINDMQPRMLMHPVRPKLNGTDIAGMKDPNGKALFLEMVDTVRRDGAGYVAYQWPKPGSDHPVDKISYVQGFAPWGWIIGSGIYVDDLHQAIWRQVSGELAWILGGIALCLLAGVYLLVCFHHALTGGMSQSRRHLHAMAEGDLTQHPVPHGNDESADLVRDLLAMQQALHGMVQRVRLASDEIVVSSGQIATGAMDLSSRTEQAAASLEQSAASMEQMTATAARNAASVGEAAKTAQSNAQAASEGGQVMGEVVQTMDGIRGSSTRIGDIIGTIDGIAFQTNILALNAAVEAARAGEQGRGFAVVASEVRSLAQRSAAAAREIKSLIGGSVDQVEAGTTIVRRAGGIIEGIVDSSRRVDELLGQVAHGAREESAGIGQIGQAVHHLDQLTQQNAALVEQTAAAAAALREQAGKLAQDVARFRLA